MAETECPKCGEKLGAEETTCSKCGWPHEEQKAPSPSEGKGLVADGSSRSTTGAWILGLGVGLVLGLCIGWFGGRSSALLRVERERAAERAVTRALQQREQPPPGRRPEQPVRLREVRWRAEESGLCKGIFEVLAAPPSVTGLEFAVLDAAGKQLSTDRVSAPSGFKAGMTLELGFEISDCSKIDSWQVQALGK